MREHPYIPTWARLLHKIAKRNATAKNMSFNLSKMELTRLVKESGGRCQITGIPFDLARAPGVLRRPFAPSLDRIDANVGYEDGNVRLVCVAVNIAMNEWGYEVLIAITAALWAKTTHAPVYKYMKPIKNQDQLRLVV